MSPVTREYCPQICTNLHVMQNPKVPGVNLEEKKIFGHFFSKGIRPKNQRKKMSSYRGEMKKCTEIKAETYKNHSVTKFVL